MALNIVAKVKALFSAFRWKGLIPAFKDVILYVGWCKPIGQPSEPAVITDGDGGQDRKGLDS